MNYLEKHTKGFSSNFIKCFFFISLFFSAGFNAFTQDTDAFYILFYNVENLFDPGNDPEKNDEEFTPDGDRRWSYARKEDKLAKISRVILYAGGWNPPAVVGLCEVENLDMLKDLVWNTGLNHLGYHIVHHPSPDLRGIDVALLYRNTRFEVLSSYPVTIDLGKGERPTRDILYVKGVADGLDTLHLMVNHWPSRYGGEMPSLQRRLKASEVLLAVCDSVAKTKSDAKMVVMGDFNDEPDDPSMLALTSVGGQAAFSLVNLGVNAAGDVPGTIKYQGHWSVFDQILVSYPLLNDSAGLHLSPTIMQIIAPEFLLEDDPGYPGRRPWRTYRGYKYEGGFSDHLPVMIRLRESASACNP